MAILTVVEVPTHGIDLVFPQAQGACVAVDRTLPTELTQQLDPHDTERGPLFYRELALSQGDAVGLTGIIAPRRLRPHAKRKQAPWVARPDLGPVVLTDRSLDDV